MQSKKKPSVSFIINAHNEGKILSSALFSLDTVLNNITTSSESYFDISIILDDASVDTKNVASMFKKNTKIKTNIYDVNFLDLAKSKNYAVENSDSDWITFVDGDDIVGSGWIHSILAKEKNFDPETVYHPSYLIFFGNSRRIHYQNLFDYFPISELLKISILYNPWGSPLFASRKLLKDNKFIETNKKLSLGYEDWTFNRRTLERGYSHKTIPNTFYLIRDRIGSLSKFKASNVYFPGW